MSDMESSRKAGGQTVAFTVAVAMIMVLILGGLVWRLSHPDEPRPPAIIGR
jgi:hypothetical protein